MISVSVKLSRSLAVLVLSLVTTTSTTSAQETFGFFNRGPYREAVPRPDDLLGYSAGERQTQYLAMQAVLDQMMAMAGDRVRTEVIGTTEEGRVMRALLISAPENIERLDEIRADVNRLADPTTTTAAEAATIAAQTPIVVLLSYSIHGNE